MKCPRCQRINSSEAKFCSGCGTPLQTAGPPALSYAEFKSALNEALEQQIATREILRVISGSPTELQPVLDTIASTARRLCDALDAAIMLRDGESLRIEAHNGPLSAPVDQKLPLNRRWVTGRAVLDGQTLHVPDLLTEHAGDSGFGDVWTWVAIDAGTKLVPSWAIGRRDGFTAQAFIRDLADRLASRVQLTSDGHKAYIEAVEGAFGNAIDYPMLIKMYEGDSGKHTPSDRRYSPAICTGTQTKRITGNPDPAHISTSFVERQNLTMRMQMRGLPGWPMLFQRRSRTRVAGGDRGPGELEGQVASSSFYELAVQSPA